MYMFANVYVAIDTGPQPWMSTSLLMGGASVAPKWAQKREPQQSCSNLRMISSRVNSVIALSVCSAMALEASAPVTNFTPIVDNPT
jgi:hypothetical protein